MRERVTVICLNRLGRKIGSITLITDDKEADAKTLFIKHKATIKKMYPGTVKIKR